jgi:hypothetical protein
MDTKQVNDFIVKNAEHDYQWLAEKTGVSVEGIRKRYQKLGLGNKRVNAQVIKSVDPEKQFQLDMEKIRLHHQEKGTDKKYQVAVKEIMRLRDDIEQLTELKGTVSTYHIKPTSSAKHESVAFAIASDWHVGENVKAETVNGSNEYTMKIAKARAEAFFKNTLKLVTKEQQDSKIDTLVLALLGDFISGNIHEELLESCEVAPVEEALFAQNLIATGIEYLLANSKLHLTIPTSCGNHSRITQQVHVSTEQGNSLEWMIYSNLANYFKNEKRVTFILSKSYFTWLKVYDFDIRFHHGHAMKFGGGVGGLTIPVLKAIGRYDLQRKAYLDVFGHVHTALDGGKFISNGSLIGDTPYGSRLGFTGKPQQQFFLIDKSYGKTIVAPVFVS